MLRTESGPKVTPSVGPSWFPGLLEASRIGPLTRVPSLSLNLLLTEPPETHLTTGHHPYNKEVPGTHRPALPTNPLDPTSTPCLQGPCSQSRESCLPRWLRGRSGEQGVPQSQSLPPSTWTPQWPCRTPWTKLECEMAVF